MGEFGQFLSELSNLKFFKVESDASVSARAHDSGLSDASNFSYLLKFRRLSRGRNPAAIEQLF